VPVVVAARSNAPAAETGKAARWDRLSPCHDTDLPRRAQFPVAEDTSIETPGPMVELSETFFM